MTVMNFGIWSSGVHVDVLLYLCNYSTDLFMFTVVFRHYMKREVQANVPLSAHLVLSELDVYTTYKQLKSHYG